MIWEYKHRISTAVIDSYEAIYNCRIFIWTLILFQSNQHAWGRWFVCGPQIPIDCLRAWYSLFWDLNLSVVQLLITLRSIVFSLAITCPNLVRIEKLIRYFHSWIMNHFNNRLIVFFCLWNTSRVLKSTRWSLVLKFNSLRIFSEFCDSQNYSKTALFLHLNNSFHWLIMYIMMLELWQLAIEVFWKWRTEHR